MSKTKKNWTHIDQFGAQPSGARTHERPVSPPDETQVALATEWLARFASPRKSIDAQQSSYNHKHRVEEWLRADGRPTYIANGAFIVAALRAGFTAKRACPDSPNVCFAMGVRKDGARLALGS